EVVLHEQRMVTRVGFRDRRSRRERAAQLLIEDLAGDWIQSSSQCSAENGFADVFRARESGREYRPVGAAARSVGVRVHVFEVVTELNLILSEEIKIQRADRVELIVHHPGVLEESDTSRKNTRAGTERRRNQVFNVVDVREIRLVKLVEHP